MAFNIGSLVSLYRSGRRHMLSFAPILAGLAWPPVCWGSDADPTFRDSECVWGKPCVSFLSRIRGRSQSVFSLWGIRARSFLGLDRRALGWVGGVRGASDSRIYQRVYWWDGNGGKREHECLWMGTRNGLDESIMGQKTTDYFLEPHRI
ncbi:hypothetical protein BGZ61DRAFT_73941 [Ilyonectria robusta]|uniref:uncharacterized protein n=1 Tax=Ilyonectria robusta TaxID=1079257 RepID=UPI001E8D6B16|nr:uncharacterized protein BGZ61DRAFT_73941 [Ilyonectria robusta]KAH8677049.1 hypothetical protein BGZ61DRAFT_73941 [Ilyonectria robusta]